MIGNLDVDGVIFDLLVDNFGMKEVCECGISFDDVIFSDGFINSINCGRLPVELKVYESFLPKKDNEYHHVIINNECFVMYF